MAGKRKMRAEQADPVDRAALAEAVNLRMEELHVTQAELHRKSGVSVATIREIQHARPGRNYTPAILRPMSIHLEWPGDHLTRVAYPATPNNRTPDPMEQAIAEIRADVAAINVRLGKIDDMETRLDGVADIINEVNSKITALIDSPQWSHREG